MPGPDCTALAVIGKGASTLYIARRACPKLMPAIFGARWTVVRTSLKENER